MARNGFDVEALSDTVAAVTEKRDLGKVTFSVNGEWQGGLVVESETGPLKQGALVDDSRRARFRMRSDEPTALLGTDTAVSPAEFILQALAGCYTVTLVANASARGIEMERYTLELEGDVDLSGFLGIDKSVRPGIPEIRVKVDVQASGSSRDELEELVRLVEQRSPIRDTLANPVCVLTTLA